MSVPENHVTAEGRTLRAAIEDAAQKLGVSPTLVEHKLDLAHFRSAGGGSTGDESMPCAHCSKDTVHLPKMGSRANAGMSATSPNVCRFKSFNRSRISFMRGRLNSGNVSSGNDAMKSRSEPCRTS